MPSPNIYAKCDFTRTGQTDPWFVVIIKMPKAKLEALRRDPKNKGLSDSQLVGMRIAGQVMTILYPQAAAVFSTGCTFYPEDETPAEIEGRTDGQQILDLTFWTA